MSAEPGSVLNRIEPLQIGMLTAGIGQRSHPNTTGWHRLPGTLLEWAEAGTWIIELEDTEPVEAAPGRIVAVPSTRLHRLTMAEGPPMTSRWFVIGLEFPNGMDVLSHAVMPPVLPDEAGCRLRPMLEQLLAMSGQYDGSDVRTALQVNRHVIRIVETLLDLAGSTQFPAAPRHLARLEPVLRTITSNLDSPLNRAQLARQAGLSATRFHYVFRQAIGVAPMHYVQGRRLLLAQRLLLRTELSVKEVAARCGYSSPQYFSRAFSREAGCAPSAYRRIFS